MPFKLDQHPRSLCPAAQHPRQSRQQQVIDLGAVGRWRHLQQLPGGVGIEAALDLQFMAVFQAGPRVGGRQLGNAAGLQLRFPVIHLVAAPLRFLLKLQRPVLVGAGARCQGGHLPLLDLAVQRLQVFQQNPPRHPVDHQVMKHQQQLLGPVSQVQQQHPQQWAVLQIQAALRLFAACQRLLRVTGLAYPEHCARLRRVLLLPTSGLRGKTQAQAVVMAQQVVQRLLQVLRIHRLTRGQEQRLVPVLALLDRLVEEPALDRRQDDIATGRRPRHHRLAATGHLGQAAHRLELENVLGTEDQTYLASAADDLHGDDGVAAQLEEVVQHTDLLKPQQVLPDRHQRLFVFIGGVHVLARRQERIGRRQRLAIELAVGRQR
ncbi:hypothetical protein D3C81_1120550 [compost metagenome]